MRGMVVFEYLGAALSQFLPSAFVGFAYCNMHGLQQFLTVASCRSHF